MNNTGEQIKDKLLWFLGTAFILYGSALGFISWQLVEVNYMIAKLEQKVAFQERLIQLENKIKEIE